MSEENLKKFGDAANCPVRNIVDRFGDKWSVLILLLLAEEEVLRFSEIHKYIQSISQKMLSSSLKALEEDGLVSRKAYAVIPPKVEYRLTAIGQTLIPHLKALVDWAEAHSAAIHQARSQAQLRERA